MRHIVTIRKRGEPATYYLSRGGLRCYTFKNAWVTSSLKDAIEQRDYFAKEMPAFELGVERLPPRLSLDKAILRAVPVA